MSHHPVIKSPFFWGFLVVLLLVGGACGFFVYQNWQLQREIAVLKTTANLSEDEARKVTEELVKEVGKLIALPSDESPTLATILDVEKLKGQPFFANAVNGDKVLVYTNARKAYLYRPNERKLIEVGTLTPGDQAASQELLSQQQGQVAGESTSPTPDAIGAVTIALRNATTDETRLTTYEQLVKQRVPTATISERGTASRTDLFSSVLYDVKGTQSAKAQALARALGLQSAGKLPDTEPASTADFVIFVGQQ